jgi:hypothetical protein
MPINESAAVGLNIDLNLTRMAEIGYSLGRGRGALQFQRLFENGPANSGLNVASFVEAAGVTFDQSAGSLRRNAVAATRSEHGAGKTFHYLHGLIVKVDKILPASAAAGSISVAFTGGTVGGGTTSTPFLISDGVLAILDDARLWTGTITLGWAGVTNKRASVIILGSDNP